MDFHSLINKPSCSSVGALVGQSKIPKMAGKLHFHAPIRALANK